MDYTHLLVMIADARISAEDLVENLQSLRFSAEDNDTPEILRFYHALDSQAEYIKEMVRRVRVEVEDVMLLGIDEKEG